MSWEPFFGHGGCGDFVDTLRSEEALHKDETFAQTRVAFASSTTHKDWALTCMDLIEVTSGVSLSSVVDFVEIHPTQKQFHFSRLKEQSGVAFENMLFFDNERWNIEDAQELGVNCIYCPSGLGMGAWDQGLALFQKGRGGSGNGKTGNGKS